MKKVLFCFLLFAVPSRAALVVFGDSASTSSSQLANAFQYTRYHGQLGGAGTVIVDSITLWGRTSTTQPDTALVGLYTDNGSQTAPVNAVSRDSVVMTDGLIAGYYRYSIMPHVQISLTAGNHYWVGLSDKAEMGGGFFIGTTASTVASCSNNIVGYLSNPWGTCTASTGAAYSVIFWGHDATGGGEPTPHQVTLRDTVKLKAGVTIR